MDCSPPGSSVHGIFQARVLEWDAIAFSEFKKSCKLINKFNKVAGYKNNIQKSVEFLYTNSEQLKMEIKKTFLGKLPISK